jgi:cysteine desulfurase family protein
MIRVYADNGATTFPKPKEVAAAMHNYIDNIGGNVGRGTYENAYEAGRIVFETRELLCELFNFENPLNVVFTTNITESLNTLIKGYLKSGDHVIVSSMEHNAVMRPLSSNLLSGVEISKTKCNFDGSLDVEEFKKHIKANTKLVVMTHASNVCGTILPIAEVSDICKDHNIPFIIDSAQSAGILDIDYKKLNLSALPFTGHKGLMGPQGIGGFIISDDFSQKIRPLKEGGTGSFSEDEIQPETLPDKFESGTLNVPGIYGLNASLKFLRKTGIDNIRQHELYLSEIFLEDLLSTNGVSLSGIHGTKGRTSVFSVNFNGLDNAEVAFMLDREFGVMTRVGLHCSPSAHKTLGTFPGGSVRFSFGYFNTKEDIKYVIDSINKTIKTLKSDE